MARVTLLENKIQNYSNSSKPDEIYEYLLSLYGENAGRTIYQRFLKLVQKYSSEFSSVLKSLDHGDAILITYGDQLFQSGEKPLFTLAEFCEHWVQETISFIHLLPFFPFSSDDGFSVIDYTQVDPTLGNWEDITRLNRSFHLMFDAVINHISAQSSWFQGFLKGELKYQNYFITFDESPDLSKVFRPRQTPLLSVFETRHNRKLVWTTFSEDQIDLNYLNPEVLLEIIEIILFYLVHGAEIIRLDAVAYLWKEIGTSCIHLPQTHTIIKLIRSILNIVAPSVLLITETNVPHQDNVSYFGNGTNEAHLVYNFALPPLVLHSFHHENAQILSEWAKNLSLPSKKVTFLNFLASHDGIGLSPITGLLPQSDIELLIQKTEAHKGNVSYKTNSDGSRSPYELNINFFDALSDPDSLDPDDLIVSRFVAAHAIMFSLVGIPGIYFHSLFGSRSWLDGVRQTGNYRSINRQKLSKSLIEKELLSENSIQSQVFTRLSNLLRIRSANPAFDPYGTQCILDFGPSVFALLRTSSRESDSLVCIESVCSFPVKVAFDPHSIWSEAKFPLIDIISGEKILPDPEFSLELNPYQTMWLKQIYQDFGS